MVSYYVSIPVKIMTNRLFVKNEHTGKVGIFVCFIYPGDLPLAPLSRGRLEPGHN